MAGTGVRLPIRGELIREARERAGLTQHDVSVRCRAIGQRISQSQVSRWESDENKPRPAALKALVSVLGVTTNELIARPEAVPA